MNSIFDVMLHALVAGMFLALACGVLGCFVVWRRMAFFGDTVAHSALLGVATGVLFELNLNLAIAAITLLIAVLLAKLMRHKALGGDTLLGILAHGSLAVGLLLISFSPSSRIDLSAFLFGDILAVTRQDMWIAMAGSIAILLLVRWQWSRLLLLTLDEDLARVSGIRVDWLNLFLILVIALLIALAIKLVGVLLITSLLIIPPAAARAFSVTPSQMALLSAAVGIISVLLGFLLSFYKDTPVGPSIVTIAVVLFLISTLTSRR